MKITRGKKTAAAPAAPAPAVTPKAPTAPPSSRNKTRVLLTVLDGKIDWQKMTPESRKQFEALFQDPTFLQQFGLSAKSSEWDPETIKHMYGGLGAFYQMIGAILLRMPPRAIEALGFTNAEKDALAEPTAKMADEYSGEFLKKHQALATWGIVFAAINGAKIKTALTIAEEERAKNLPPRPGARPQRVSAPPARPSPGVVEAPPAAPAARAADPEPEIIPVQPITREERGLGESLEMAPVPVEHLKIPDADLVSPL